ncbi:membrane bound O-acyl transferase family-domain-containing protein [Amylostereum chailletii]|nr:membrane bound O-acyl transferase family-domain-containing protein [Amylostereum chailletii]
MERSPLSFVRHIVLPDILLITLIATQPPTPTRFLGFAVVLYASVTALACTAGGATTNYSIGFLLGIQVFTALRFLWLERPLDVHRHERDGQPPREMSIWRRLYWAFCLDHGFRGVGWTHQVKNVPPRPTEHPGVFIGQCLLRALWYFLLADAANTYVCAVDGIHPQGYALRTSISTAWICVTYAMLNSEYLALAALAVALRIGRPEDWPDIFGSASEAFTLRNFWGKVWHQNLRRLFVPLGQRIAQAWGFKRGTLLSSYTQLYAAFVVSGVIHSSGDAMVGRAYTGVSMPFFLLQAAAITGEDAVVALGRRLGIAPSRAVKTLGYVWVFGWISATFSMYRDLSIETGWDWSAEWPISPSSGLLRMVGVLS